MVGVDFDVCTFLLVLIGTEHELLKVAHFWKTGRDGYHIVALIFPIKTSYADLKSVKTPPSNLR